MEWTFKVIFFTQKPAVRPPARRIKNSYQDRLPLILATLWTLITGLRNLRPLKVTFGPAQTALAGCNINIWSQNAIPALALAQALKYGCGSKQNPLSFVLGRVGGVVTQRIANPCTPVRFRYSPPQHVVKFPVVNNIQSTNFCTQFLRKIRCNFALIHVA